ncbi:MAG: hypothetical protein IPK22_10880 [Verrucomicrobiaceae bacterium]|nr:hypothetical protein [Verrucomicrobiaceae bacterium]
MRLNQVLNQVWINCYGEVSNGDTDVGSTNVQWIVGHIENWSKLTIFLYDLLPSIIGSIRIIVRIKDFVSDVVDGNQVIELLTERFNDLMTGHTFDFV